MLDEMNDFQVVRCTSGKVGTTEGQCRTVLVAVAVYILMSKSTGWIASHVNILIADQNVVAVFASHFFHQPRERGAVPAFLYVRRIVCSSLRRFSRSACRK